MLAVIPRKFFLPCRQDCFRMAQYHWVHRLTFRCTCRIARKIRSLGNTCYPAGVAITQPQHPTTPQPLNPSTPQPHHFLLCKLFNNIMANPRWSKLTYPTDSEVPRLGELILLPYPVGLIPFGYGPASSFLRSANQSHAYSTVSTTISPKRTRIKAIMHHVLVLDASHDPSTNRIRLEFLPIMSYSSPPSNLVRSGYSGVWSGER